MTYEKIVEKVKKALSKADASEVKEHLAVQVDVYGEGEGAFYIEVKDGKVEVQSYEYFDHDLRIRCTGDEIIALAEGKKKIIDEVNASNIEALRNVSRLWDFDTVLSANKAKAKAEKKAEAVKTEKPAKKEKVIDSVEKKAVKADKKVTKKATKEDRKDTKVSEKVEKKAKKTATKEKKVPDVNTIKAVVAGDKKATDKVIGMYEDEILKEVESKLKPLYTHSDGTENEMLKAELKKQIEDGLRTELPKFPMDKPVKAEKKASKAKADKKETKAEKKVTQKVAKADKKNEKPDKVTKKAEKKVKTEKKSKTTKVEKTKKSQKTEKTE